MSTPSADQLRTGILDLLDRRASSATICPSEVARSFGDDSWRDLTDAVRDAAADLVAAGDIEVTQRGEVVDLAQARGPIRLRRRGTR